MPSNEPRVLIVESHDILRVMLFTVLRHQPLAVDTATTATEALEKVTACDYALILIDLDMPDHTAEEFLTRFNDERPESTSFVLAVRDPKSAAFVDPQMVSALLNKPLELDTLAELVRETAQVIPPPEDPLDCPPAESEIRSRMERSPYLAN